MLIPFFLCWGSFLNVVAFRLLHEKSITGRSYCPHCLNTLAWYDLIPLFSYIALKGKCRYCSHTISSLYPLIELITTIALYTLTSTTSPHYWFAYGIFFSALIVTIRTDLEALMISSFATLFLIPVAFLMVFVQSLPLSLPESFLGALSAYGFLYAIERLYYFCTKRIGLGYGDIELIACIGAFTGFLGWWSALLLASLVGSFYGLYMIFLGRQDHNNPSLQQALPFGPFLALGAMVFVCFNRWILYLMLYGHH